MDLNLYKNKVLSQYGQDGVLSKIFDIIGTTNKYFVEFGSSGNDEGLGNTAYLRSFGFDGLLLDGDEKPYSKYKVENEFITSTNINSIFNKYNVPNNFDFLSIDVDGQDFHIWNALDAKYNPRVVSIEINFHIEPYIDKVMKLNDYWIWQGDEYYGSSITAIKKLGNKKGYSLVAVCVSDAIFVKDEYAHYFSDVNDEYTLINKNPDINDFNKCFNFSKEHFDIPFFVISDTYLDK